MLWRRSGESCAASESWWQRDRLWVENDSEQTVFSRTRQAANALARTASKMGRPPTEFSSGKRESCGNKHTADTLEAVGESARVSPVPAADVVEYSPSPPPQLRTMPMMMNTTTTSNFQQLAQNSSSAYPSVPKTLTRMKSSQKTVIQTAMLTRAAPSQY